VNVFAVRFFYLLMNNVPLTYSERIGRVARVVYPPPNANHACPPVAAGVSSRSLAVGEHNAFRSYAGLLGRRCLPNKRGNILAGIKNKRNEATLSG